MWNPAGVWSARDSSAHALSDPRTPFGHGGRHSSKVCGACMHDPSKFRVRDSRNWGGSHALSGAWEAIGHGEPQVQKMRRVRVWNHPSVRGPRNPIAHTLCDPWTPPGPGEFAVEKMRVVWVRNLPELRPCRYARPDALFHPWPGLGHGEPRGQEMRRAWVRHHTLLQRARGASTHALRESWAASGHGRRLVQEVRGAWVFDPPQAGCSRNTGRDPLLNAWDS